MDKEKALEVLGLDAECDEAAIGRSKKKLCHKNRAVSGGEGGSKWPV